MKKNNKKIIKDFLARNYHKTERNKEINNKIKIIKFKPKSAKPKSQSKKREINFEIFKIKKLTHPHEEKRTKSAKKNIKKKKIPKAWL